MFEQSRKFFDAFNAIFLVNSPYRQKAVAAYVHNTEYTRFITQRINDIIRKAGSCPQNEYYRIDVMGYSDKKELLTGTSELAPHLWDLEIAVEHENSSKDWLDEVIKLAHICCPLRVVIGYVPMEQRSRGDVERLVYASAALRQLKCRENLMKGEFMVILGNSNTKEKEENFFHYKAYVLNSQTLEFESLSETL